MQINIVVAIATAALFLSGCDRGGISHSDSRKPDAAYHLESAGTDLRVYEFTMKHEPNVRCVFVAGKSKAGVSCFQKYSQ